METLIEIDKLIKQAKAKGVKFGKGDPYNRLRYYTKIGWLPHMTRKKTNQGKIKGHYPNWALERILLIEKLKDQGLSNDQITEKVSNRKRLQNFYAKVGTEEFKNKIISYISVIALILILLMELEVINVSKSKNDTLLQPALNLPAQILDSGISFVPANNKDIFVRNDKIRFDAKVYVTFNQNFSPANRYWVAEIDPGRGFYVELDAPVFDNVEFSWWISN